MRLTQIPSDLSSYFKSNCVCVCVDTCIYSTWLCNVNPLQSSWTYPSSSLHPDLVLSNPFSKLPLPVLYPSSSCMCIYTYTLSHMLTEPLCLVKRIDHSYNILTFQNAHNCLILSTAVKLNQPKRTSEPYWKKTWQKHSWGWGLS